MTKQTASNQHSHSAKSEERFDPAAIDQNYGKSLRGYNWNLLECDINTINNFVQKLGISEILARIIVNRGVKTIEDANQYLSPKLRDIFPDPATLKDMDRGVKRVIEAINARQKVVIFADYDVDGATSGAVLYRFFTQINFKVEIYVPNRTADGYGLNEKVIQKFKDDGFDLVITVDCGSSAVLPLKLAQKLQLDVIILDHHIVSNEMPQVVALINPRRPDDNSEHKSIAAVTVVLIFVIGIRQELRRSGWFEDNNIEEPDIMPLLSLVALGTVCDVMPLDRLNRILVKCGLHFIKNRSNVGIAALMDMMMSNEKKVAAYHLGFAIGPRINAGGRIDESRLGVELLITDDEVRAREISQHMEQLNTERRIIENNILEEVIIQIERFRLYEKPIIVVIGESWHIGVLGILASRVKDRYHKPCVVASVIDGKVVKGSGRSIVGIDMGSIFGKAKELGIIIDGGGHAMAGGFNLSADNIDRWRQYLYDETEKAIITNANSLEKARQLDIDAVVRVSSLNSGIIELIEQAMPFGYGNPQPCFMLVNVRIVKTVVNKSGSVGAFIIDSDQKSRRGYGSVRCVVFRGISSELGKFLIQNEGAIVNLVGTVQPSPKLLGKIDFVIEDIGIFD